MKLLLPYILIFIIITGKLYGQTTPRPLPLASRQVSGVLLDSAGAAIAGATIKLLSQKDTLTTISDKDGIFIFDHVKLATFYLTVSEVGYSPLVKKCLNNDQAEKIVLPPITLKVKFNDLEPATVKRGPTIIYKIDTVEYRASDYKVPEYATIDELLKKMEGMEVLPDGSLIHQGQAVTKVKLNGTEFNGGNVAQAIQNLPANIVEKIQIANDYGDQAARTGIKTGNPSKTLNIYTKDDKSIGYMAQITSQEGNNNRYNEQISAQNLNANRVISLIGNVSSTVNGIASSPITTPANSNTSGTGGSSIPGTTQSGAPTFSYTDDWGNNTKAIASYTYTFNNTRSISNSYGQINSNIGPSDFTSDATSENDSKGHTAKFQLEQNIGKFDYLQLNPSFTSNNSIGNYNAATNNLNYFSTGFEHPAVDLVTNSSNNSTKYGLTALFVHLFKNPKQNFSAQVEISNANTTTGGDKNADYRYYADSTEDNLAKDSLSHLLTNKTTINTTYRAVITYVEPLNTRSQLEFTAQTRDAVYDNTATADTVLANGQLLALTRLENIYNYSFIDSRLTANARLSGKMGDLSLGVALVPSIIAGTEIDNNTNHSVSTSRTDWRVIPIFRYYYAWSSHENFQIFYTGENKEPGFQQMQPFIDRSDPNNIVVGNPNLKPSFIHVINATYNDYFPNQRVNLSFGLNARFYDARVTTNILQLTVPVTDSLNNTINETTYVNLNGDRNYTGRYDFSKQLNNRQISLELKGFVNYAYTNAMSDNVVYHTTQLTFDAKFGPRINLNEARFLMNPYIEYETNKSKTSTLNATPGFIQTFKLAVDGQIYLPGSFQVHYVASKNFLSGFTNYSMNPFVVNAGFEKRFLGRHNLALTFDVFDLLHQNNFIHQSVTPMSTTYTYSNNMSRYFLVGIKFNLQRWGGTPIRNGQPMQRRGDGSFVK